MFDLLIKNAWIYDGLGNAPQKADIGIKDGKIAVFLIIISDSIHDVGYHSIPMKIFHYEKVCEFSEDSVE